MKRPEVIPDDCLCNWIPTDSPAIHTYEWVEGCPVHPDREEEAEHTAFAIDVTAGDPHNDQLAARASDQLDKHLGAIRSVLEQMRDLGEEDEIPAIMVAAMALEQHFSARDYGVNHLSALLAMAMYRLVSLPDEYRDGKKEIPLPLLTDADGDSHNIVPGNVD